MKNTVDDANLAELVKNLLSERDAARKHFELACERLANLQMRGIATPEDIEYSKAQLMVQIMIEANAKKGPNEKD